MLVLWMNFPNIPGFIFLKDKGAIKSVFILFKAQVELQANKKKSK